MTWIALASITFVAAVGFTVLALKLQYYRRFGGSSRHSSYRNGSGAITVADDADGADAKATSHRHQPLTYVSKYPPAEPGALVLEPLKAACPCRSGQASLPSVDTSPSAEPPQLGRLRYLLFATSNLVP